MAALAYLFPPLSGLVVYLRATSARPRFHGLQAVLLGVLWPAALYVCSLISPGATQIAFGIMTALWVVLLVGAALGRDPGVPVVSTAIRNAAKDSPRGAPTER